MMFYLRLSLLAVCIMVLAACGAETEIAPTFTLQPTTAALPTATLTPIPDIPTATAALPAASPTMTPIPSPTLTLAASPDDIIGTWVGTHRQNMVTRFNADGTLQQAQVRSVLDTNPNAAGTYVFDGTHLVLTTKALRNLPECPSETAIYQVVLLGTRYDPQIRFIAVEETCRPRAETMTTGIYEKVK